MIFQISVNKFIEPTDMNGEAFFSRWKNLSMPSQVEAQHQNLLHFETNFIYQCSGEPKDLQGRISDGECGGNKDETYWLWLPATRR